MKRRLRQFVRRNRQRGYAVATLVCYLCASLGVSAELPGTPGVGCRCDSDLQQAGNCCCSKRVSFLNANQTASANCCAGSTPASEGPTAVVESTPQQTSENPALPAGCRKSAPAEFAVPACCQPKLPSSTASTCCSKVSCCGPGSATKSAEEAGEATDYSLPGFRSACGCGHEPISGFLLNGDPRLLVAPCTPLGGWLQVTLGWGNLGWSALNEGPDTPPPRC